MNGQYELTDEKGGVISLRTDSHSVVLLEGGTLAEHEPVHPLVTIRHDLDAYPYVMLLKMQEGEGAALLPVGVRYAGRDELTVCTVRGGWGKPKLHKIRSREYCVTFDGSADTMLIRLI